VLTLVKKHSNHSTCSRQQEKAQRRQFEFRPVTTQEMCEVNLATLREGVNHCRWPREVIEQFLAVQV
jgi:hypothetical protein